MDYIFYTVEIETGKILGRYSIYGDVIRVHHHIGVSLYDQTFAIIALQRQEIHILQILDDGAFMLQRKLGCFFFPSNDEPFQQYARRQEEYIQRQQHLAIQQQQLSVQGSWMSAREYEALLAVNQMEGAIDSTMQITNFSVSEDDETRPSISSFTVFQQALLSWLYRKAASHRDTSALEHFYKNFEYYLNLKLWRMQLLSKDTLLIKMVPYSKDTFGMEQSSDLYYYHNILYVLFDLKETCIKDAFDGDDSKVEHLVLVEDALRGPSYHHEFQDSSTPGSNAIARAVFKRQIYAWQETTNGSYALAMRKLGCYLPNPPSSQTESVYFDLSLYRYDRKLILASDKSRVPLNIIKFYSRATNEFKFALPTTAVPIHEDASTLNLSCNTAIIPHPFFPFIVTRRTETSGQIITNFHVYKQQ